MNFINKTRFAYPVFLFTTLVFSLFIQPAFAQSRELIMPSTTTLHETKHYKATRQSRYFIVSLKQPHQVLSTSDINDDLDYIVNFKSVEANGHNSRFDEILSQSNQQYHQELASTLGIDAKQMASMGTAANINHLVHVQKNFRQTTVDAFVTAGVHGNALRAGDTTRWVQGENGNEFIKDAGTINIILLINRSLTPGAQAKAATIVAEAKSAALAELAIPSKQSQHLATGTGTDQYAIATPANSSLKTLDSASGHLKLGELIGAAVREAVLDAIALQNSLERSDTRSIIHSLGRFGMTKNSVLSTLEKQMNNDDFELLKKNKKSVFREPKLVAAAYAYAALLDRLEYGTLSPHIESDVLLDQAVNAAIAVSGKSQDWQYFRSQLSSINDDKLTPFINAISAGWQRKWVK